MEKSGYDIWLEIYDVGHYTTIGVTKSGNHLAVASAAILILEHGCFEKIRGNLQKDTGQMVCQLAGWAGTDHCLTAWDQYNNTYQACSLFQQMFYFGFYDFFGQYVLCRINSPLNCNILHMR